MCEERKIKESKCPVCNAGLNAAEAASEEFKDMRPEPGDLSVCTYCATILIFDEDLNLAIPEQEFMDSIPDDVTAQLKAVVDIIKEHSQVETWWN